MCVCVLEHVCVRGGTCACVRGGTCAYVRAGTCDCKFVLKHDTHTLMHTYPQHV